jgi:serine/threonine-protein kinase
VTAGEIGAAIVAIGASSTAPASSPRMSSPMTIARAPAPKDASIAVLPFACAADDRYLADGIFEDLIDTLSTTARIRVRPSGAVVAASAASPDPQAIGRALEVEQIITGSLRRTPTGVRVTARLLGVADGFQIWSQKIDCADAEVLVTSQQLARGIAAALSTRSTVATRPTDPRAVDLFLRARAELRRFWGAPTRAASDLLGEAFELAPSSPQIAGAYAYAAVQSWVMNGDPQLLARAERAVAQALATGHGDAFLASAQLRMNHGDLVGGAGDLGTAIVLAPMSGQAHEAAARILLEVTSFDAAARHFETARGLEPGRGKVIDSELARMDALAGDHASALRRIEELAGDPDPAIAQLGEIFEVRFAAWRGDVAGALAATSRIVSGLSTQAERMIGFIRESLARRAIDEDAWGRVVSLQYGRDRPTRLRVLGLQLLGETAILLGAEPLALSAIEQASQLGLIDVNWIDRCPLFGRVVDRARWSRLRAEVASRAHAVLEAFEASGAQR